LTASCSREGLYRLHHLALTEELVVDLDSGNFLKSFGQGLGFIFMCWNGFRQYVDFHPFERRGGVDEPLHLFHLIGRGEGRRLEFVVDPFFRLINPGEARARIERHRDGGRRGDYFRCH
jgi:hypothetical protein